MHPAATEAADPPWEDDRWPLMVSYRGTNMDHKEGGFGFWFLVLERAFSASASETFGFRLPVFFFCDT